MNYGKVLGKDCYENKLGQLIWGEDPLDSDGSIIEALEEAFEMGRKQGREDEADRIWELELRERHAYR